MKKVLFKSEELLIAADSESKVVYGNTRRNSAVKYLNELTPKSNEDALRIADKFGLKAEVQRELDNGAIPLDALREWDII